MLYTLLHFSFECFSSFFCRPGFVLELLLSFRHAPQLSYKILKLERSRGRARLSQSSVGANLFTHLLNVAIVVLPPLLGKQASPSKWAMPCSWRVSSGQDEWSASASLPGASWSAITSCWATTAKCPATALVRPGEYVGPMELMHILWTQSGQQVKWAWACFKNA